MNKIYRLDRVLTHLRSFNVFKVNSTLPRRFSTKNDSGGEENSTSSESSVAEKETQIETKDKVEVSDTEAKLGGFAQSYKKFSRIDEKEPEVPQTFASLIRHSKFVDVSTLRLVCVYMCTFVMIRNICLLFCKCIMSIYISFPVRRYRRKTCNW